MAELSIQKICSEFKESATFFYTALMSTGIPSSCKENLQWLPSVAGISLIVLKKNAVLLMTSQFFLSSVFRAMFNTCHHEKLV